MPPGIAVRPRELLKQPLPDLKISAHRTTHHGLHAISFQGPKGQWHDFEDAALIHHATTTWPTQTLAYRPANGREPCAESTSREQMACGSEMGVQGRWLARVGQDISAVCRAAGTDILVADWRACQSHLGVGPAALKPDVVFLANDGNVRVVGEIKFPWIDRHRLDAVLRSPEPVARNLLGNFQCSCCD